MKLRINSGIYRGRVFNLPDIKTTRPLKANIKECLFNVLQDKIKDQKVLDLYAGQGSFGIEALSYQAKFVHFNDANKKCTYNIQKIIQQLKINSDKVWITNYDSTKLINYNSFAHQYDVIFFDPPFYEEKNEETLSLLLNSSGIIHDETIVIFRSYKKHQISAENAAYAYKNKIIGTNQIWFLQKN